MKARKIHLPLGPRSYDIYVGPKAVSQMGRWLRDMPSKRAFLISDESLVQARKQTVSFLRDENWEVHEIAVRAGERLKDVSSVYHLYGSLLNAKANRDSVLFALGGGTIGDAAGFVAATYLRGISWVGLPTTLLAQVDSSVGGKTGINHELGKNLIGSFHQPSLVVCDTDFLKTLSKREIMSGLGETVKYGLIFDPVFYRYIEKSADGFLKLDSEVLTRSIVKSLQWKCRMVARDELDRKGIREALNFGHTFGHALESITRYKRFQHGEAIIIGMRFALALSEARGRLPRATRLRIDSFLSSLDVPAMPRGIGAREIFAHMSKDKKIREGKLHFVLLDRLGHSVSDARIGEEDLIQAYDLAFGAAHNRSRRK